MVDATSRTFSWSACSRAEGSERGHLLVESQRDGALRAVTGVNETVGNAGPSTRIERGHRLWRNDRHDSRTGHPASLPSHEDTSATSASNLTSTPQPPLGETYGWPHTVKWVAAGVAVAGLGFGLVEHLRYYSKNRDYNNDASCPSGAGCKSLADSADLAHTLAIVGYGAAAVATGAAITLWLLDSPVQTSQASLGFACLPTVAGVVCNGRF